MLNERNAISSDYQLIIQVLDSWWGGRQMALMLPKLFFEHFGDTSFVISDEKGVVGFIVGFKSPKDAELAYVHFVGVNPEYRVHGIGRRLYELFIEAVKCLGAKRIECVTSPTNTASIGFHLKLGFMPKMGDRLNDNNVPYASNYDGPGQDRVVLSLNI